MPKGTVPSQDESTSYLMVKNLTRAVITTIEISGTSPQMPGNLRKNIVENVMKKLPWEQDIKWSDRPGTAAGRGITANVEFNKGKWYGKIRVGSRDMSHHEAIFLLLEGYTMSIASHQLVCSTSNSAGVKFTTKIALR